MKHEVLQRDKEERNILHKIEQRNANWIGHILLRNCLLKHDIEGKIEGMGRPARRRKQLLDILKETLRYLKLKDEALDRIFMENSLRKQANDTLRCLE